MCCYDLGPVRITSSHEECHPRTSINSQLPLTFILVRFHAAALAHLAVHDQLHLGHWYGHACYLPCNVDRSTAGLHRNSATGWLPFDRKLHERPVRHKG